jgi:hypothetical protein
MVEAEELSTRVAEVMYHAGEPALWALVLIEAGECPEKQAYVLYTRMFDIEDSPLRKFSRHLQRAYIMQTEAMNPKRSFQVCREEALQSIRTADALADEIIARSSDKEERRKAQAAALRGLYNMKELNER